MDERLAFLRQEFASSSKSVQCSFQHRASGAEGPVDLQYWPARRGLANAPEQLTVFILGNPGLLGYYPPFLDHLHSLLPDTHAILATSHVGHSTTLPPPAQPFDLPAQLESKIELVQALRAYLDAWAGESGQERPKLALLGHSVGAWLLCEVMKRLNRPGLWDAIHAGYLLFPTLGWIANTFNGWTLWPIFHRPFRPLLPLLSPLLRPILPWTSLPPTSLSLVRSPTVIEHVLHLSKSEMELIREPDLKWFRSQCPRADGQSRQGLFGAWSAGRQDGWVGQDGPLVQEALGGEGERVKLLQGVPHAFCLTQEHSELVAGVVARWIGPDAPSVEVAKEPSEPTGANIIPM